MNAASNTEPSELFATVVAGGYCVGCGACAAVSAKIGVELGPLGTYRASLKAGETLSPAEDQRVSAACGFSPRAQNEDQIASRLYSGHAQKHPELGYHAQTFTGHVSEGTFRAEGSSGGMGTWIAAELLRLQHVDAVLHVRPQPNTSGTNTPLFEFCISRSIDELRAGSHSHYYPVTLAAILAQIKSDATLRYALIGIPCFIKAARLLAQQDASIADAIRYYIGLVCGHLKSSAFAMSLGWQAGIEPGSLDGIDFRHKIEGKSPRKYGFRATGRTESGHAEVGSPMSEMFGADWGLGLFKYKACDYCDDVFAETADVVIGDAWLPRFDDDWRGTNVLIVRHTLFAEILAAGAAQSRIQIAPITPDEAATSQRSGLSHRREGLSWRLSAADRRGDWHPPKRVAAGSMSMTRRRRNIYQLREKLRDASHVLFAEARARNSPAYFEEKMQPLIKRYYDQFKPALRLRVKIRFKRLWTSWLRQ